LNNNYSLAGGSQVIIEGVEASLLFLEDHMLESVYQARLIKELYYRFPGCVVIKNDTSYMQGIPDLLILFNDKWAMLEVKSSADAKIQPNQSHYVDQLDVMSFAAFIYPENEEEVLNALQRTLRPRRSARVSQR